MKRFLYIVTIAALQISVSDVHAKLYCGPTMSWYKLRESAIFDVGGNKDKLVDSTAKIVPGFVFGWETKTALDCCQKYHGVWGLSFGYSGLKRAVKADYQETGAPVEFAVKQHVTDLRFTPYVGVEMTQKQNVTVGANVGCAIARKVLDNFVVHYKANNAFCGLSLEPQNVNILGEFSVYAFKEFSNSYRARFAYNFSAGHIKYGKQIFIGTPDEDAPEQFDAITLLTDIDSIYLEKEPVLKLLVHRLSLSLEKEF